MPAVKKTEPLPNRKSNTATARFAVAEPDPDDDPAFDPPTAPVSTATAPHSQPSAAAAPIQSKEKDPANGKDKDSVTIEDLTLPKSIVTRLAKGVLQPNTQIQANAILALSKSATVFINYLAHYANENTLSAGKKTIMPADVFKAIEETEFGFMRAKLEAEFAKFHETNSTKRSNYRKKVAMAKKGGEASADASNITVDDSMISNTSMASGGALGGGGPAGGRDGRTAPRSKKPKLSAPRQSIGASGAVATAAAATIAGASKMDVDEEVSDAETVPDEPHDEEDEEQDGEEDEEDDEEDEDDNEEQDEDMEMDDEQHERREQRRNYDEALDDGSDED